MFPVEIVDLHVWHFKAFIWGKVWVKLNEIKHLIAETDNKSVQVALKTSISPVKVFLVIACDMWHVTCDITPPVDPQWHWESGDNDGANQSTDCTHFIVWTTHWSLSNLIYAQAKSFHSAVKVQLMIWPDVAYFLWYYVYMCLHINIFECVNISTVRIRGSNLCIKL